VRVVTRVVSPFGHVGLGTSQYVNTRSNYDYAIGGIPFISAVNDQRRYTRETAPIKKDQFDNSQEPGEQSLAGWWLRSQSSFHGGAGVRFADLSQVNPQANLRCEASSGVDMWTPGVVNLLKDTFTDGVSASGNVYLRGFSSSGNDYLLAAHGTTLRYTDGTTSTGVTWGGAGSIKSITDDGSNYYVADGTVIQKGALPGGAGALLYNAVGTSAVLGWAHQRLVLGLDNKVYELTTAGPGLPTVKYTHPSASWVWTCVADAPGAILMAGFSGSNSAIYKFTLDSSGVMPALSGGILAASMPVGETVRSMAVYMGNILVVGTSRGIRVGNLNYNQDIEMGPLSVSTPASVLSLASRDRFVYGGYSRGIDGSSGLVRVDLGFEVYNGRYAYASDLQVSGNTADVTSVVNFGNSDRMAFGLAGTGAYVEHATRLISQGYLRTGRVRFSTLEPKLYKLIRTRGGTLAGSLSVSAIDANGASTSLVNYGEGTALGTEEVSISSPSTPQDFIQIQFTLNRKGADNTQGASMAGYQLKALPGTPRKRIITVPLLCYDNVQLRNGERVYRQGGAWSALQLLETLDAAGDVVMFQDLTLGTADLVTIEQLQFVAESPTGPRKEAIGGIINVAMRTI
jgi:hypothetical protein